MSRNFKITVVTKQGHTSLLMLHVEEIAGIIVQQRKVTEYADGVWLNFSPAERILTLADLQPDYKHRG